MIARAVAVILLATGVSQSPPSSLRHFKEDHLTGADYLRLSSTGRYDVLGREHMGIFALDEGTWSTKADTWRFTSTKTDGATFTCHVVALAGRTFVVWSGKDAPGLEIPEADVRADLKKDPTSTPPYVFFEIPQEAFDRETQKRYPFKFYPEMNDKP